MRNQSEFKSIRIGNHKLLIDALLAISDDHKYVPVHGINADQWTTAAQDEGEWRRTAEQGAVAK